MQLRRRYAASSVPSCLAYCTHGESLTRCCAMFLKSFEENWTAWLDDALTAPRRSAVDPSSRAGPAAEAEKNQAHKLGALLKEELQPRAMRNEEFFHHQLRS